MSPSIMMSTPRVENGSPGDAENSPVEGISNAIRRAMVLQDKLRKAISNTAPIHCSGDRSLASLNREREALLLVRDHLEVLENKLRDIRCLESRELADKDGCMYDLDTYRRNLLEAGKGVLNSKLTDGSRALIAEILTFVDGGSTAAASPSPLAESNRAMHRSPLTLSDLSASPFLSSSFLKHRTQPLGYTPMAENRASDAPSQATYGKAHIRNNVPARRTSAFDDASLPAIPDNMSELYADIRTSCAASRACSVKNDDGASLRSGRHSCANCGHEMGVIGPSGRPFRPLKWLSRALLLAGVVALTGKTEWGRSVVHRYHSKASLGSEFDTGSAMVANGVEAFESHDALAVWGPRDGNAAIG